MRKYRKRLKQEIEEQIPDIKLSIKMNVNWDIIKANNYISATSEKIDEMLAIKNAKSTKKESKKMRYAENKEAQGTKRLGTSFGNRVKVLVKNAKKSRLALASIACILILTLCISLPLALHSGNGNSLNSSDLSKVNALSYDVTIEVNPSIRLTINEQDIVTNQQGLNKDGVVLLYNENFVGSDVLTATKDVLAKINEAGFFNGEEREIKFCLSCENGKKIKDFQSKQNSIEESITNYFADIDNVKIKHITDTMLKELEKAYKENNISDYANSFDENFRQELISKLDEKIDDANKILQNWLQYLFGGNKSFTDLTLDDFEDFCQKYDYPLQMNDMLTKDTLRKMYINLVNYQADLINAREELTNGGQIESVYDEIADIYFFAKEWFYNEN